VTGFGALPEHIVHDSVPPPVTPYRDPGHAQFFLNPPQPQWINPTDR
jgi:hypothetical protein